ncbi:hypothetical protein HDU93_009188 [Gonapodya sp. JEL0774]|nr:hypothetical protein HDU93_009188 [Gonapodya sp. JEL0774]
MPSKPATPSTRAQQSKRKRAGDVPTGSDGEEKSGVDAPATPSTAPNKTKKQRPEGESPSVRSRLPTTPPPHEDEDEEVQDAEDFDPEDDGGDPIEMSPSRPSTTSAVAKLLGSAHSPSRHASNPMLPTTPHSKNRFSEPRNSQDDLDAPSDADEDGGPEVGQASGAAKTAPKPPSGSSSTTQSRVDAARGLAVPSRSSKARAKTAAPAPTPVTPDRAPLDSGITPATKHWSIQTSPATPAKKPGFGEETAGAPEISVSAGSAARKLDLVGTDIGSTHVIGEPEPKSPPKPSTITTSTPAATTITAPSTPSVTFGSRLATGATTFGALASPVSGTGATSFASFGASASPFGASSSLGSGKPSFASFSSASSQPLSPFASVGAGGSVFGSGSGTTSSFSAFSSGGGSQSAFSRFGGASSFTQKSSLSATQQDDGEDGDGGEDGGEAGPAEWEAEWNGSGVDRPKLEEVAVATGEEEDQTLMAVRCKLYAMDEKAKEWKERGTGTLKVNKSSTDGRGRILMRQDAVLRVLLNVPLFKDMPIQSDGTNFIRFAAPEAGSTGTGSTGSAAQEADQGKRKAPTFFMVKTSTPTVASELVLSMQQFVK